MDIFWAILLLVAGFALTIKGADFIIKAASWFADVTGVSKAVIGATVVAFATSASEFFVSLFAVLKGYGDISMGNIVGSNIVNLGIGFAIIAIWRPHSASGTLSMIRKVFALSATITVLVFAFLGFVSIYFAIALLLIFVVYTFIQIKYEKETEKPPRKKTNAKEIIINVVLFVLGIAGAVFGSNIIVDSAKTLGTAIGISDYVIGITIVAIGSSLDDIITSIVALVKKENDMSVGNLIGSNIFNITFVLGAIALASGGISIASNVAYIDLPFAMGFLVIAVGPTLITKKIQRFQGYLLAAAYVGYITVLCIL